MKTKYIFIVFLLLPFLGQSQHSYSNKLPNLEYSIFNNTGNYVIDGISLYADTFLIKLERNRNNLFRPGTKWYYDDVDNFTVRMLVDTYEIKKITTIDNAQKEVYDMGGWYMYDQDDRWYIKDEADSSFRLIMDFNEGVDSFAFEGLRYPDDPDRYYDGVGIIDSIRPYTMPDNTVRDMYYVHYKAIYHLPDHTDIPEEKYRRIIKGIGFMSGGTYGVFRNFFHPFADPLGYTGQLRCFTNDTVSYSFVNYACDSIWFLGIVDPAYPGMEIRIFPNPSSSGILHVKIKGGKHPGLRLQITDLSGRIIKTSDLKDADTSLDYSGLAQGFYIYRIVDKQGHLIGSGKWLRSH